VLRIHTANGARKRAAAAPTKNVNIPTRRANTNKRPAREFSPRFLELFAVLLRHSACCKKKKKGRCRNDRNYDDSPIRRNTAANSSYPPPLGCARFAAIPGLCSPFSSGGRGGICNDGICRKCCCQHTWVPVSLSVPEAPLGALGRTRSGLARAGGRLSPNGTFRTVAPPKETEGLA
jgi:hypothetical protein